MTDHLSPASRKLAELPLEDRIINRWEAMWFGTRLTRNLHVMMQEMVERPDQLRPRCLLIWGESGVSKSRTLDHFRKKYPEGTEPVEGFRTMPVVLVSAPEKGDVYLFHDRILDALKYRKLRRPTKASDREQLCVNQLEGRQTKLIMLDELSDILIGRPNQAEYFMAKLRQLSSRLKRPIVGTGINTVLNAVDQDETMKKRFGDPIEITRWSFNDDFIKLLHKYEVTIPLQKASQLDEATLGRRIFDLSGGIMSEISDLMLRASIEAVVSGEERISHAVLDRLARA